MFSLLKIKNDIEVRRKMLRFINEQNRAAVTCYEDQRDESRSTWSLSVLLVPLEEGEPNVSKANPAIARDISTTGIAIITPYLVEMKEAIVVLPGDEQLFAQIEFLRNRPMGLGFSVIGTRIVGFVSPKQFPILEEVDNAMKQICSNLS